VVVEGLESFGLPMEFVELEPEDTDFLGKDGEDALMDDPPGEGALGEDFLPGLGGGEDLLPGLGALLDDGDGARDDFTGTVIVELSVTEVLVGDLDEEVLFGIVEEEEASSVTEVLVGDLEDDLLVMVVIEEVLSVTDVRVGDFETRPVLGFT
jgi:hypothetical protein